MHLPESPPEDSSPGEEGIAWHVHAPNCAFLETYCKSKDWGEAWGREEGSQSSSRFPRRKWLIFMISWPPDIVTSQDNLILCWSTGDFAEAAFGLH